jgi:hypothetical protein
MEDKMHGWDVQRMLVDTRCLRIMIMSLSKSSPQTPTFGELKQGLLPNQAGVMI